MPGFFARRRARGHSPHVSKECGSRADADLVIDLHCDREAVAHLYTTPGAAAPVTFELRDVSHELAARHPGDRRQCEGAARGRPARAPSRFGAGTTPSAAHRCLSWPVTARHKEKVPVPLESS
ncbi:hypothetical protein BG61_40705 [Caballeronia glathei]|uniref:Succinylglutamate desuccinylase n=1 Tax=Caballeronia glathei TaxID=60547 RepID=A0A069PRT3_9BURK|nr:hypothetical protein BG61_40705 [Caballeronia glathei]